MVNDLRGLNKVSFLVALFFLFLGGLSGKSFGEIPGHVSPGGVQAGARAGVRQTVGVWQTVGARKGAGVRQTVGVRQGVGARRGARELGVGKGWPDFAFPKGVADSAEVLIRRGLRDGDGKEALEGAVQLVIARNLVSDGNCVEGLKLFERMGAELKYPYNALGMLLEGRLLTEIYRSSRFVYDGRRFAVSENLDSVKSWGRDSFVWNIVGICRNVNALAQGEPDQSIMTLGSLVEGGEGPESGGRDSARGVSVKDFIAYQCVEMLEGFKESGMVAIPFEVLDSEGVEARDGGRILRSEGPQAGVRQTEGEGGDFALKGSHRTRSGQTGFWKGILGEDVAGMVEGILGEAIGRNEESGNEGMVVEFSLMKYRSLPEWEREGYLRRMVERFRNTPYCGPLLLEGWGDDYKVLTDYLAKFPECVDGSRLRGRVAELLVESVSLEGEGQVLPQMESVCKVTSANVPEMWLLIVNVPDKMLGNSQTMATIRKEGKLCGAVPVKFKDVEGRSETVDVKVPGLEPGTYVFVPSRSKLLSGAITTGKGGQRVSPFSVSSLTTLYTLGGGKGDQRLYVTEGGGNKPISGAKVVFTNTNKSKGIIRGVTSSDGSVTVPEGSYSTAVTYRNNYSGSYIWNGVDSPRKGERTYLSRVFTDRSIYKPGEKVEYVVVAYSDCDRELSPESERGMRVWFMNPNGEAVDSIDGVTDRYGRINGSFTVPTSSLLGDYLIQAAVKVDSKEGGQKRVKNGLRNSDFTVSGSSLVKVAEYKAPKFFIETKDAGRSYEAGDTIVVEGAVKNYNGTGAGDVNVRYEIVYRGVPWRMSVSDSRFGGEAETTGSGEFSIKLSTKRLKDTPYAVGEYQLRIIATNSLGETQESGAYRFTVGKDFHIVSQIPERICLSGKGEKDAFIVRVEDLLGRGVSRKVYYRVYTLKEGFPVNTAGSGEFVSPRFENPFEGLASGRYRIVMSLSGDFDGKGDEVSQDVTVYRQGDRKVPYPVSIWVTDREVVVPGDCKRATIKVGGGYPGDWILMRVTDCDGVIESRWLKSDGEVKEVQVVAPKSNGRVFVTFRGVHNLEAQEETVTLIPEEQKRKLSVEVESFRDRITPGGEESWKFRFLEDGKPAASIPAVAVLSNKALNTLVPFAWNFDPFANQYYPRAGYLTAPRIPRVYQSVILGKEISGGETFRFPEWQTYGQSLYSGGGYMNGIMVRELRNGKLMSRAMKAEEAAMDGAEAMTGSVLADSGMGMPAEEGSEGERSAIKMTDVSEAPGEIRDGMRSVGIFMPTLVSDGDGDVEVPFRAPDFLGTWQLQLLGYDEKMRGAVKILDAVSSKPVMVQVNSPLFLRTQDVATVVGSVVNNSGVSGTITSRIEILDPMSGQLLGSHSETKENVGSGVELPIEVGFQVPDTISLVAIKISGVLTSAERAGGYDGIIYRDIEQNIIPVYPSSTPVVESETFYLSADTKEFSLKLAPRGKDEEREIVYCDNPMWECVKALPGLVARDSEDALSVAGSLFGNSVGYGLTGRYPQILRKLEDMKKSGALQSALIGGAEKTMTSLTMTPWVQDAVSENLRLDQLLNYSDRRKAEGELKVEVGKLLEFQLSDGGWCWTKGGNRSMFISELVLRNLAQLQRMGYLPAELRGALRKTVSYLDGEYVRMQKRGKGSEIAGSGMLNYLYLRSIIEGVSTTSEFRIVQDKALREISKDWKQYDIREKAQAAILMRRVGQDELAGTILKSIGEFGSETAEKGMWFDNLRSGYRGVGKLLTTAKVLEAYSLISPGSKDIDKIRQWLLLSKLTEDWGESNGISEVLYALLTTGTDWTAVSGEPEIRERDGELRIERGGGVPAWGGVITRRILPITSVKGKGDKSLSIAKRLTILKANRDGATVGGGVLKVGDKVRVSIEVSNDKDLDYVSIVDGHCAGLTPTEQVSGYEAQEGVYYYREVRDNCTNFYIEHLPKGVHVLSYDCYVGMSGEYSLGIAQGESLYWPAIVAHSGGKVLDLSLKKKKINQ